jgi:hypothetical protein
MCFQGCVYVHMCVERGGGARKKESPERHVAREGKSLGQEREEGLGG